MRLTALGIPYNPRVTKAPFAVLLFIGVDGPRKGKPVGQSESSGKGQRPS